MHNTNVAVDYQKHIVTKPWGSETVIYQNPMVEIWHLKLKNGHSTSMHCHPDKKTSLIVISGLAKLSFLSSEKTIKVLDKVIIRPGLFHSTTALSDLEMLEIETPRDKENIVRLSDSYNRPTETYSSYQVTNKSPDYPDLNKLEKVQIGQCELYHYDGPITYPINKYHLFMVVGGSIKSERFDVLGPGDVVDSDTLRILSEKFTVNNLKMIIIKDKYDESGSFLCTESVEESMLQSMFRIKGS